MKTLIALSLTLFLVACGGPGDPGTMLVNESAAADVTICTCVNEPISTDERANACNALMNSMSAEDIATETVACRSALPVPDGGPDLCFCLQVMTPTAEIAAACEDIIPKNITPTQMAAKVADCARQ